MSDISDLVQAGAAVLAVAFTYMKLSGQQKTRIKTLVFRSSVCVGALFVFCSSVFEIVKFGISALPLTRFDVLWLLVNIWNGAFYGLSGLALAVYWARKGRAKTKACDDVNGGGEV